MAKTKKNFKTKRKSKRRIIRQPAVTMIKMTQTRNLKTDETTGEGVAALIHCRSFTNQYIPDLSAADPEKLAPYNFAKVKDLFDLYRVKRIKLTYKAYFLAQNYVSANAQTLPAISVSFDPDNTGVATPVLNSVTGTHKNYSLGKDWTWSRNIPKYQGGDSPGGWQNMQSEQTNYSGAISIYNVNSLAPPPGPAINMGSLRIDTWVECKARTDHNPTAYYGIDRIGHLYPAGLTGPQDRYAPPTRNDGEEREFIIP